MANITFKHANKPALAELCIKHRLFIPGWALRSELEGIKIGYRSSEATEIQVAFEGETPIAVMVMIDNSYKDKDVQVFVRAAHRRRGIATKLFHRLTRRVGVPNRKIKFGSGVTGSEKFFYSVGL